MYRGIIGASVKSLVRVYFVAQRRFPILYVVSAWRLGGRWATLTRDALSWLVKVLLPILRSAEPKRHPLGGGPVDELSLLVRCIATGSQLREQAAIGLAGAVARLRRIGRQLGPLRGDCQYNSGLSIHTGAAASLAVFCDAGLGTILFEGFVSGQA